MEASASLLARASFARFVVVTVSSTTDPDFRTFVAIDSETDDLPVGETRRHWAADALAKKDLEIARCEDVYRHAAHEAASHLVARFAQ
ncbi:MAG: hypothetical protein ACR2HH_09760 [Chthoniobacterales bacterium]